ncbi:hypothetical protein ACQP3J_31060, partial [Escherichia coli]
IYPNGDSIPHLYHLFYTEKSLKGSVLFLGVSQNVIANHCHGLNLDKTVTEERERTVHFRRYKILGKEKDERIN